jgi:hypothetical protein
MGCAAGERKKKLYIASRRDGVRGRREKKKLYIAGQQDGVRCRRGKNIYISPADEMGWVAGRSGGGRATPMA